MAETLTPDICVIGAGSGGLSVAAAAAAFGVPVVLIEKAKMGGECLNTGCVPSKALIAAAKHAHAIAEAEMPSACRRDRRRGRFRARPPHVHDVIAAIAPNDSRERFTGARRAGDRRRGALSSDPRHRDGRPGDEHRDQGAALRDCDRLVAVAAADPRAQAIRRTSPTRPCSISLRAPEHLIVIGAGPIGLELAQAFRRLGAAVTVLEAASRSRARTRNAPPSCSTRSRAKAWTSAADVAVARVEGEGRKGQCRRCAATMARRRSRAAIF